MTKREAQKVQRKKEILEKSLDLFIKKGYSATTIRDISDALSISVGLLFHYFPSKEDLYIYLVGKSAEFPRKMRTAVTDTPLSYLEKEISELFSNFQTDKTSAKFFVLFNQAMFMEDLPPKAKKIVSYTDLFTVTTILIKKGQKDGSMKQGDPVALSVAFWSAIKGIAETISCFPNLPVPDSDWVLDILRK